MGDRMGGGGGGARVCGRPPPGKSNRFFSLIGGGGLFATVSPYGIMVAFLVRFFPYAWGGGGFFAM